MYEKKAPFELRKTVYITIQGYPRQNEQRPRLASKTCLSMVFRNFPLFVGMNGGDGGADRLLSFAQQAASSQALSACSDHSLLEVPPAPLPTLVPQGVRLLPSHHRHEKTRHMGGSSCLVEMARVELASESISKGLSPSAVNVLEFRLDQRPLTGYGLSYPVSPL